MKLNSNFDPTLEETINLYAPLADWFARNQEIMAYFEMTHKGRLHMNSLTDNNDIIALGKMANAGLNWLEAPKAISISPEEKAIRAALSMALVYEREKDKLSEDAKIQYYIDIQGLQREKNEEEISRRM